MPSKHSIRRVLANLYSTPWAITDEKFAEIREMLVKEMTWTETAGGVLNELAKRVAELERLWVVARENPELVRELAAQALKGRGLG